VKKNYIMKNVNFLVKINHYNILNLSSSKFATADKMIRYSRGIDFPYLSERRCSAYSGAVTFDSWPFNVPSFPMHCHSIIYSYLEQHIHTTDDAKRMRGRFGGPATCNLRKVQVSGKRLMRATREYGPLFRAIKQFSRTHGIMFLLFSISPDIERRGRKIRATKMG